MSISSIKQIKRILKEHDVRDPRGALQAIEQVVAQPKAEKPATVLTLSLIRTGSKTMECIIKTDPEQLLPRHVVAAQDILQQFGEEKFGGECNDPECPVHGENAKPAEALSTHLKELFDKFEAEQLSKLAAKKGNLQ